MTHKKRMEVAETGKEYYVSVDGNLVNNGSKDSPWNLEYALTGAIKNKRLQIQAGDTVWVRGGIYRSDNDFVLSVSGNASNKITFKACPGETVILDGSIPEFTTIHNRAWVPDDIVMPGHHVYRSTEKKFDAPNFTFYGGFIQINCEWYSLAPHKSNINLLSPIHEWQNPDPKPIPRYLGPGIAENNGYLYIRLDNSTPQAQLGRPVPQIGVPDPNEHQIYLCKSDRFGLRITGSHLVIEGFAEINHFGGCFYMGTANQTDITIRNCGGRPIFFGARCGSTDGLTFDNCHFEAHMPSETWWVAYEDIKGVRIPDTVPHPGEPPADHVRKVGLDLGVASNVTVINCQLEEFFDGILASAVYEGKGQDKKLKAVAHDVEVSNTTFNHIWDDAWQMIAPLYQINFHHNYCFGAGPSVDGSGASLPNPQPGTVYIHHNVIDTTKRLMFWGRQGSPAVGMYESLPLSSHAGDATTAKFTWPRKLYHNTIVTGRIHDPNHTYIGWSLLGSNEDRLTSQAPHEVYNNIFLVLDGRPGGKDFDATSRQEIYDGNVYWHYRECSPSTLKSPWHRLTTVDQSNNKETINLAGSAISLADFHTKLANTNWQAYYPPGWEHSGLMEDPTLDSDYKPHTASCKIGAVDLTGKSWWGMEPYEAWRGAVQP